MEGFSPMESASMDKRACAIAMKWEEEPVELAITMESGKRCRRGQRTRIFAFESLLVDVDRSGLQSRSFSSFSCELVSAFAVCSCFNCFRFDSFNDSIRFYDLASALNDSFSSPTSFKIPSFNARSSSCIFNALSHNKSLDSNEVLRNAFFSCSRSSLSIIISFSLENLRFSSMVSISQK
jgi:hypothetical protein